MTCRVLCCSNKGGHPHRYLLAVIDDDGRLIVEPEARGVRWRPASGDADHLLTCPEHKDVAASLAQSRIAEAARRHKKELHLYPRNQKPPPSPGASLDSPTSGCHS